MKKKNYYTEDNKSFSDILKLLCIIGTIIVMSIVYFKTYDYVVNKGIEYYEEGR